MHIKLITGGRGPERAGSLVSGRTVIPELRSFGHKVSVVDLASPLIFTDVGECDLVFPTTHGWFGEDGKLQGALDILGVPYIGSGALASTISMYKPACLRIAQSLGIRCPPWAEIREGAVTPEMTHEIFERLGPWVFIKPASGGGSIGAGIAKHHTEFSELLNRAQLGQRFLASKYIQGTDVTVALLEIDGAVRFLPPLATRYDAEFYNYEVKHTQRLRSHECPARIPSEARTRLEHSARTLYHALPCEGFARFDFIVDQAGNEWFLEVNTLPGLSRVGNFATMAAKFGLSYTELIGAMVASHRPFGDYRP